MSKLIRFTLVRLLLGCISHDNDCHCGGNGSF